MENETSVKIKVQEWGLGENRVQVYRYPDGSRGLAIERPDAVADLSDIPPDKAAEIAAALGPETLVPGVEIQEGPHLLAHDLLGEAAAQLESSGELGLVGQLRTLAKSLRGPWEKFETEIEAIDEPEETEPVELRELTRLIAAIDICRSLGVDPVPASILERAEIAKGVLFEREGDDPEDHAGCALGDPDCSGSGTEPERPEETAVAHACRLLAENDVEPGVACVHNLRSEVPLWTVSDLPRCAWGIKHDCGCGQGGEASEETAGPLEREVLDLWFKGDSDDAAGLLARKLETMRGDVDLLIKDLARRSMDKVGAILGATEASEREVQYLPALLCEAADFIEETEPDAVALIQNLRSSASQSDWEADPTDPRDRETCREILEKAEEMGGSSDEVPTGGDAHAWGDAPPAWRTLDESDVIRAGDRIQDAAANEIGAFTVATDGDSITEGPPQGWLSTVAGMARAGYRILR